MSSSLPTAVSRPPKGRFRNLPGPRRNRPCHKLQAPPFQTKPRVPKRHRPLPSSLTLFPPPPALKSPSKRPHRRVTGNLLRPQRPRRLLLRYRRRLSKTTRGQPRWLAPDRRAPTLLTRTDRNRAGRQPGRGALSHSFESVSTPPQKQ